MRRPDPRPRAGRLRPPLAAAVATTMCLTSACATSPLGRRQLVLFPAGEMAQMGVAAYDQMKQETPLSTDARSSAYVRCVADAITAELDGAAAGHTWEVQVFADDAVNAFALPGAKIGVYEGLLEVAQNQDQLATVIGHEVAHVLARHSNERVSTAYAAETGAQLVAVAAGAATGSSQQELYAMLGLGAQVGVLLPFGRAQESEADLLGLDLMASAGFDPRQSVPLWHNMDAAAGGERPPDFLSTHPGPATRIAQLEGRMPTALELHDAARAAGKSPRCAPGL